jgi:hypothetical protein
MATSTGAVSTHMARLKGLAERFEETSLKKAIGAWVSTLFLTCGTALADAGRARSHKGLAALARDN